MGGVSKQKMAKINMNISVDPEVYFEIKRDTGFNVSGFCNEQLKKALNIKELKIPEEEILLKESISQRQAELTILEQKHAKILKKRSEEEKKRAENKKRFIESLGNWGEK